MTGSHVWHETLGILADLSPPMYWRLADGVAYWFTPLPAYLRPDRVEVEPGSLPIRYRDIRSVTVFDEVRQGQAVVMTCDWAELRRRLGAVAGLRMEELRDVHLPPAAPPNRALELKLA